MSQNLVDYGIQNEQSDIRVHVCPVVKRVYVYPTSCGLRAVETGNYPLVNAYQEGVEEPTATGHIVPPFDIEQCVSLTFRSTAWDYIGFLRNDNTSEKGDKAVKLVEGMLKQGLFPLPFLGREVTDRDIQIDGTDIIVNTNGNDRGTLRLQVKCDYPGGEKGLGGTGNLFLQKTEQNPNKRY